MLKNFLKIIKNPRFILVVIICIGFVLRLLDANKTSFWYDEAFTGNVIKLPWKEMFLAIAGDRVHPPLFYILIRLWSLIFGVTQLSLRGFSIFWGTGLIGLVYVLGKEFLKKKNFPYISLLLSLVVSLSPFFIAYSVEARAYSFIAFLAVLLVIFVLKFLDSTQKKESMKFLGLSLLLAITLCATHYLQLIFVIAIICAGIIYKFVYTAKGLNIRGLVMSLILGFTALSFLFFLPVKELVNSLGVNSFSWMPHVNLIETLRVYYSYFFGVVRYVNGLPPVREFIFPIPTLVLSGILFVVHILGYICILIKKNIEREDKRHITFFVTLSLITFFGFYLLGILGFDCYLERYMIAGGIVLLLSFVMIIGTLFRNWYVCIPIVFYIALTFMLKPLQLPTDYREIAKNLDSTNNVQRYIFVYPFDMVNIMFYMKNQEIYYFYEYDGEYSSWSLLTPERGLKINEIAKGDVLVVPNDSVEKFTRLGFSFDGTVGDGLTLLVR